MNRTDESIRADLVDRLASDRSIEASRISVEVENGRVTLWGAVPTDFEKFSAYYDASEIAGVTDVKNLLKVDYQPAFIPPPEQGIEYDIRKKLACIFQ